MVGPSIGRSWPTGPGLQDAVGAGALFADQVTFEESKRLVPVADLEEISERKPLPQPSHSVVLGFAGQGRGADALDLMVSIEPPLCGPGPGELQLLRGHLFIGRPQYTLFAHVTQIVYTFLVHVFDPGAHNEYTDFGESRRTEAPEAPRSASVVNRRSCREERRTPKHDLKARER